EEKAKSAMKVALSLGENNRFILRSASRCFTHMGEPDRAVSILNKSGLCSIDPWIASAEIAISECFELKSKNVSKAKKIIDNDDLTHFSRSELTASLATIEMKSGSIRRSSQYMRQALTDPTENALAQVEWLSNQLKTDIPEIVSLGKNVPASFEAMAMHFYYDKKYKASLEASKLWGNYQPLSSRPIIHSSHIAAMYMDDDNEAIRILDSAMPAQKDDPIITNNYAFSYARSGNLERAMECLKNINLHTLTGRPRYIISATKGLIAFREGNPEAGRSLYSIAVKGFEENRDYLSADIAMYFWAIEEKRINSKYAKSRINNVKKRIERHNVSELEELVKKL
ncbi:hypothetical protein KA005_68440, partial [bacterium]|nr:hypothetical protein [bacterium]